MAEAIADLPIRSALDIGGSSGVYLCALVDRLPFARGAVLERAPIDVAARTLVADRGYADRIRVITGDMFEGLPDGYDLHLFSNVLHDWDAPQVYSLLATSFESLSPGGWLVDHDLHINADKTGPLAAAEYSVLLMHGTVGKCWSVSELAEMLTSCGFDRISTRELVGDRTAVLAHKPG